MKTLPRPSIDARVRLVWRNMRARCYNPNNKSFHVYGGRGIKVCDRWLESVQAFASDMGPRPTPDHTLDRIDNDRGYSPENCRWATRIEQARNRRSNRPLTFQGATKCMAEWADAVGIRKGTLHLRLKMGWSVNETIATPVGASRAARVPKTDEICKAVALLTRSRNKLLWEELRNIERASEEK